MTKNQPRISRVNLIRILLLSLCLMNCSSEDKGKKVVSQSRLKPLSTSSSTSTAISESKSEQATSANSRPEGAPSDALLTLHQNNADSCIKCHEANRPTPDHFAGQDCVSCHKFPSFKIGGPPSNNGGGEAKGNNDPLLALHQSNTKSCIKCHEPDRPSPDHFAGQDCVSCHKFPNFKGGLPIDPGAPPGQAGDTLLALHEKNTNSCNKCHEAKRPSPNHYPSHDCASCHKFPSFKGGFFAHNPKPTSCEECHARPSQVGRNAYPRQGPPANFNPADKKAPGSGHYVGKDCLSCHATPREGATAFSFSHSSPNPQACLPCHFNEGASEHGNSSRVTLSGFGNCQNCHQNFARPNRNFDTN